jgi:hypothetical protein
MQNISKSFSTRASNAFCIVTCIAIFEQSGIGRVGGVMTSHTRFMTADTVTSVYLQVLWKHAAMSPYIAQSVADSMPVLSSYDVDVINPPSEACRQVYAWYSQSLGGMGVSVSHFKTSWIWSMTFFAIEALGLPQCTEWAVRQFFVSPEASVQNFL